MKFLLVCTLYELLLTTEHALLAYWQVDQEKTENILNEMYKLNKYE
jgi:hypothetical protein